jgi:hypothetical protein
MRSPQELNAMSDRQYRPLDGASSDCGRNAVGQARYPRRTPDRVCIWEGCQLTLVPIIALHGLYQPANNASKHLCALPAKLEPTVLRMSVTRLTLRQRARQRATAGMQSSDHPRGRRV